MFINKINYNKKIINGEVYSNYLINDDLGNFTIGNDLQLIKKEPFKIILPLNLSYTLLNDVPIKQEYQKDDMAEFKINPNTLKNIKINSFDYDKSTFIIKDDDNKIFNISANYLKEKYQITKLNDLSIDFFSVQSINLKAKNFKPIVFYPLGFFFEKNNILDAKQVWSDPPSSKDEEFNFKCFNDFELAKDLFNGKTAYCNIFKTDIALNLFNISSIQKKYLTKSLKEILLDTYKHLIITDKDQNTLIYNIKDIIQIKNTRHDNITLYFQFGI